MTHWIQALDRPYDELCRWVEPYDTPREAWEACPRADWLMFALAEAGAERATLILCACDCAELLVKRASLERQAIEVAREWARTLGSAQRCREASVRVVGPGSQVAQAASIASRFWEMPRSGLGRAVAAVVRLEPPDETRERGLAERVHAQRWPLRQPSATEIRRAQALAVAWDRISEEIEPTATLSTVQALCSYWTALELGLDLQRPVEWDSIVIRAVAERLQLAPQYLPEVKHAIASVLG
jgi:hypothetical protein